MIAERLLNLFLPAECLSCRQDLATPTLGKPALCDRCVARIEWDGRVEHGGKGPLDAVVALCEYAGPVRDMIHAFKYRGKETIGRYFGSCWANIAPLDLGGIDGIAAVPMSPWKEWRRGYNPARILAEEVARLTQTPFLEGGLSRRWISRSQTGLRRKERLKNAGRSFYSPERPGRFREKSILLIDDVCTTGATLEACAALLKKAGARRVIGAAAARERGAARS